MVQGMVRENGTQLPQHHIRRRKKAAPGVMGTAFSGLGVTSRVIVDSLLEQLGPLTLPVLEGSDGRSALQG